MSTTTTVPLMTVEELLALPDNGMERDLVEGQLRERPMTRRNRRHARTTTLVAKLLALWSERQTAPRGEILTGDAAFCLGRNPDTTVGVDVAYIGPELAAQVADDAFPIAGAPYLAVKILCPSDTHEDIVGKIELYLESGVPLVWIVDPDLRTVTMYRPGQPPVLYNATQQIADLAEMPGLSLDVSQLFSA